MMAVVITSVNSMKLLSSAKLVDVSHCVRSFLCISCVAVTTVTATQITCSFDIDHLVELFPCSLWKFSRSI